VPEGGNTPLGQAPQAPLGQAPQGQAQGQGQAQAQAQAYEVGEAAMGKLAVSGVPDEATGGGDEGRMQRVPSYDAEEFVRGLAQMQEQEHEQAVPEPEIELESKMEGKGARKFAAAAQSVAAAAQRVGNVAAAAGSSVEGGFTQLLMTLDATYAHAHLPNMSCVYH
jgi:hypothetical protein